jgi:hypothetical protein
MLRVAGIGIVVPFELKEACHRSRWLSRQQNQQRRYPQPLIFNVGGASRPEEARTGTPCRALEAASVGGDEPGVKLKARGKRK